MNEPFLVRQTSKLDGYGQGIEWVAAVLRDDVWPQGGKWWRVSWLEDPLTILVEAWKERPDDPDDAGAPRFAVQEGGAND